MSFLASSLIVLVCSVVLGAIVLFLLIYYFGLFGRFVFRKEKGVGSTDDLPKLSIIITAHDEAHLLAETLPLLLTQEYPDYEVVLVNDNSHDEIEQLALEMNNKYHHLHYVNLCSSRSTQAGKRFPMAIGIQAATHKIVVFTEACCTPTSPFWLQHIASRFVRTKEVVLAHTTYNDTTGLHGKWLHYDALQTTLRAFSCTIAKMPVLANSHNLAYRKDLFFSNKEKYLAMSRLPFGEDNIFVNQVVAGNQCDIAASPDAVIGQPALSFSDWLRNKRYELVSQSFYRPMHRLVLQIYNWLAFWFYPAAAVAITLAAISQSWVLLGISCGSVILKIAMQYLVLAKGAKKIGEKKAVAPLILFDLLFVLLQPWIYLASKIEKSRWI